MKVTEKKCIRDNVLKTFEHFFRKKGFQFIFSFTVFYKSTRTTRLENNKYRVIWLFNDC